MSGIGMAKSMWTNFFIQIDFYSQIFDDRKNHGAGELTPSSIEEQSVLMSFLNL
jgi:hypothetical protein